MNIKETILAAFGALAFAILMTVISVPLAVFFGWVTGCIVKFFCGSFVASGLNTLFGTTRFTPDTIPIIGGVLGFIGSFFKSISTSKSKND